jgi:hypothetical protein
MFGLSHRRGIDRMRRRLSRRRRVGRIDGWSERRLGGATLPRRVLRALPLTLVPLATITRPPLARGSGRRRGWCAVDRIRRRRLAHRSRRIHRALTLLPHSRRRIDDRGPRAGESKNRGASPRIDWEVASQRRTNAPLRRDGATANRLDRLNACTGDITKPRPRSNRTRRMLPANWAVYRQNRTHAAASAGMRHGNMNWLIAGGNQADVDLAATPGESPAEAAAACTRRPAPAEAAKVRPVTAAVRSPAPRIGRRPEVSCASVRHPFPIAIRIEPRIVRCNLRLPHRSLAGHVVPGSVRVQIGPAVALSAGVPIAHCGAVGSLRGCRLVHVLVPLIPGVPGNLLRLEVAARISGVAAKALARTHLGLIARVGSIPH